jgi:hypothetical protein
MESILGLNGVPPHHLGIPADVLAFLISVRRRVLELTKFVSQSVRRTAVEATMDLV